MRKLRDVIETKSTRDMKWVASGVYIPENKDPPKQTKFPKLISILISIFFFLSCSNCTYNRQVTFIDTCTEEWVNGEMTDKTIGVSPLVIYQGRTYVIGPNATHTWGWQCYHLYPKGLKRAYYRPKPAVQKKSVGDSI